MPTGSISSIKMTQLHRPLLNRTRHQAIDRGSRSSMYRQLFQQMVCAVLESESYLFSTLNSIFSPPSSCSPTLRGTSLFVSFNAKRILVST